MEVKKVMSEIFGVMVIYIEDDELSCDRFKLRHYDHDALIFIVNNSIRDLCFHDLIKKNRVGMYLKAGEAFMSNLIFEGDILVTTHLEKNRLLPKKKEDLLTEEDVDKVLEEILDSDFPQPDFWIVSKEEYERFGYKIFMREDRIDGSEKGE